MKFTANCVICRTDDNVAMLGFADEELNTTKYVLLQKELQPSQQDLRLGHDKPHIEINDQRHSGYGGVEKAQLQQNHVALKLGPQAAADMSVDDTIEISFFLPREKLMEIGNQLRLLFGADVVQIEAKT